jgi:hypothetical protein
MKTAYFDCPSGISGDMICGALIHAGADSALLKIELSKLGLTGWAIDSKKVLKAGITGTKFTVTAEETAHHRSLKDILSMINSSSLSPFVKKSASAIFSLLGNAESKIHSIPVNDVHFHEIGAVDSIIDIVAACVCIELLSVEKIFASPIPTGSGFVDTAHGRLPVPAPAALELLKGAPLYDSGIKGELVTPTGAAFLKHFAAAFGPMPALTPESTGYGAGTKDLPVPNLLRVIIGESSGLTKISDEKKLLVIETNIDDMNPEIYQHAIEKIISAGALDAMIIPGIMKKGRCGALIKIITAENNFDSVTAALFAETSTAGMRYYPVERVTLEREIVPVSTEWGSVNIKVFRDEEGGVMTASPEYEDCRKIAAEKNIPLKNVYEAAKAAWNLSPVKVEARESAPEFKKGMVQIYTGDGKGKTTAAMGLAARAAGRGLTVLIIQFMKHQPSGEILFLEKSSSLIKAESYGLPGFFNPEKNNDREPHEIKAKKGYNRALEAAVSGKYNMIILDEILTAGYFSFISDDEIISLIDKRSAGVELILTGRGLTPATAAKSDLITEMKCVKHYYEKGITAREGIEF